MVIKKLYEFFRDKTLFNREKKLHSIDEERLFFSGLPKAGDRMEKAFLKYRCMSWYNYPFFTRILFNLGAALILPFAYIYYISRPADKKNTAEKYDAVIRRNNSIAYDDIIPEILTDGKKVKEIARYDFKEGILDEKAREIYAGITRKYRGHFYFRLLVLLKLAEYRGWITKYSPDAILVYAFERDVALPLKTELCEYYDVEHIGFMHGDLIYSVDKAYIDLTKYYIWDMHYRDVLMEAGAESEQFVLYEPKIFRKEISGKVPGYEITYYFSAESELLLRNVYKKSQIA